MKQNETLHLKPNASPAVALSIKSAAASLGLSRPTIYRLINKGELRAHKCGTRTLILTSDITAFVANLPQVKQ